MGALEDAIRSTLEQGRDQARRNLTDWGDDSPPPVPPEQVEEFVLMETVRLQSRLVRMLAEAASPELGVELSAEMEAARQRMPARLNTMMFGPTAAGPEILRQVAEVVAADRKCLERLAESLGVESGAELAAAPLPTSDGPLIDVLPLLTVALGAHEEVLVSIARRVDEEREGLL